MSKFVIHPLVVGEMAEDFIDLMHSIPPAQPLDIGGRIGLGGKQLCMALSLDEQPACLIVTGLGFGPGAKTGKHDRAGGCGGIKLRVLLEEGNLGAPAGGHAAGIRRLDARKNAKERALARSVQANEAHPFSGMDG